MIWGGGGSIRGGVQSEGGKGKSQSMRRIQEGDDTEDEAANEGGFSGIAQASFLCFTIGFRA